jgi:hypothetical protein
VSKIRGYAPLLSGDIISRVLRKLELSQKTPQSSTIRIQFNNLKGIIIKLLVKRLFSYSRLRKSRGGWPGI